ncbi:MULTISPECIES: hypothetical protein [Xenorhabdus]|uniref:hypothetical protein n=1 Tax=Xenorhabdus TaxID=626 RepID=UPI00068FF239|nr:MULTISPECIES: hypothetical protein [Xenorhabdus]MBC8943703.1 hypothetical protein [Xenorhabdus indica]
MFRNMAAGIMTSSPLIPMTGIRFFFSSIRRPFLFLLNENPEPPVIVISIARLTNPYLVVLTENGRKAFSHAMALEAPWMNQLAEGISLEDIHTMNRVLKILRNRLNEEVIEE